MHFSKISLFSFICLLNLTQHKHITAMETVEQSIQLKLDKLDIAIIALTKQVKVAEEQKNRDKIAYDNYRTHWNNKYDNACIFKKPFISDFNHESAEVRNYKGDVVRFCVLRDYAIYSNDGSEGKYNNLLEVLLYNETIHRRYKENFKRGKRQQNLEYLQLINQDLQNYIDPQTINDQ